MDPQTSYLLDILFTVVGLFFATYLIYGRIKRKPLIGDYNRGTSGYNAFLKIVDNNKYLVIAILGALFFLVNAVFDAIAIMNSPSSSTILVAAPILTVLVLFLAIMLTPAILGKNNKNK